MAMNEKLHAMVVLSSRKEAFLYVRQEAEWVHLLVCTLCRKGISLLLPEFEPIFLCRPARRLVTIMTDVSQLFSFGFFIRILLSASNNFLQLIPSTLITLKERNIYSVSQPLWDSGPVNSFFIRRGSGPKKCTRKCLSNFFKVIQ